MSAVASTVYKTIYSTLNSASSLSYITTFQSRFFPVRREMEIATLYPYLFLSFGEMSGEQLHAMPNIVQYSATIGIIVMTWNEGDVNVQTDASNLDPDAGYADTTTKGVLEIVEDVKDVLYTEHKFDRFGYNQSVSGTVADLDWNFGSVENPSVTSLQPLLLSPYVEAKQINIIMTIREDRNQ